MDLQGEGSKEFKVTSKPNPSYKGPPNPQSITTTPGYERFHSLIFNPVTSLIIFFRETFL